MNPGSERNYYENNGIRLQAQKQDMGWQSATPGLTAQGIEIVRRKSENKLRQTLARIEEIAKEYGVEKIVLGFPKHMNNDIGERAEKSLEFKEMLGRRTGLPVVMWDERLTTVEADRTMMETGIRGKTARST